MPTVFDDWESFVREYCLDVRPSFSKDEAVRAFAALAELWPDGLTPRAWGAGRGIVNVAFLVRLGTALADTRNAPGFARVLVRARNDERGALSEIYFAAKLSQLGYAPRFEPEFGGKRPDLAIETRGIEVCFEVIAPEQSDLDKAAAATMHRATEMLKPPDGCRLDVEMLTFPTTEHIEDLRREIAESPRDQLNEIPDIARWRIESRPENGPGSHFRWPGNDRRAVRLVRDEYHHFADNRPYVLVVDANAPLLTIPGWTSAFERTFQPNRYRKLSAGVVFTNFLVPPHFSPQWRVRVSANPFTSNPVPLDVLNELVGLDEPFAAAT